MTAFFRLFALPVLLLFAVDEYAGVEQSEEEAGDTVT